MAARMEKKLVVFLHRACKMGHISDAQSALDEGCDVDSKDRVGRTPLHAALIGLGKTTRSWFELLDPPGSSRAALLQSASPQHHELIRELVEVRGAAVNVMDCYGMGHTPLNYAASMGCDDVCRLLLTSGARVDGRGPTASGRGSPFTPLHSAMQGYARTKYADFGRLGDRVSYAVRRGWLDTDAAAYFAVFQLLLGKKADVNAVGGSDTDARLPLQLAVMLRDVDLARLLLKSGADPDGVVATEALDAGLPLPPPLHHALSVGDAPLCELLLTHGANANLPDMLRGALVPAGKRRGEVFAVPLQLAIGQGQTNLTQLLIDHGADPNARVPWLHQGLRIDGAAPLLNHVAGSLRFAARLKTARVLVAAGASVNNRCDAGDTALHSAAAMAVEAALAHVDAAEESAELCWELVENGASVQAHNDEERTALEFVQSSGEDAARESARRRASEELLHMIMERSVAGYREAKAQVARTRYTPKSKSKKAKGRSGAGAEETKDGGRDEDALSRDDFVAIKRDLRVIKSRLGTLSPSTP